VLLVVGFLPNIACWLGLHHVAARRLSKAIDGSVRVEAMSASWVTAPTLTGVELLDAAGNPALGRQGPPVALALRAGLRRRRPRRNRRRQGQALAAPRRGRQQPRAAARPILHKPKAAPAAPTRPRQA
jgi:hypothetical protein